MASLQYLGFIVTAASLVDNCLHKAVHGAYSFGKNRVPTLFETLIEILEKWYFAVHKPLREWFCTTAETVLQLLDDTVDKVVQHIEGMMPPNTSERVSKVRKFWTTLGASISSHWKTRGVILGTFSFFVTLAVSLISICFKALYSEPCKSAVQQIQELKVVVSCKTYYKENVESCLKKLVVLGSESFEKAKYHTLTLLEAVGEKVEPLLRYIVGHGYYRKGYHCIMETKQKIESTAIYEQFFSMIEPYVGPTLEKIKDSDWYITLVEKLAPFKEE